MSKKLTKEYIALKTKNVNIQGIKQINLWGSELNDVSIFQKMPQLQIISVSLNKLTTLKHFANMNNLKELYARNNLINDINEVKYLSTCPKLKILWLSENPICNSKQYRSNVIKLLPNLYKLDDIVVSEREKKIYNGNDKEEEDRALIEEEELDQYADVDDKYDYRDYNKEYKRDCINDIEKGRDEFNYDNNNDNYYAKKSDLNYGGNQRKNRYDDIEIRGKSNRASKREAILDINDDNVKNNEDIRKKKMNNRFNNEKSNLPLYQTNRYDILTNNNCNEHCKKSKLSHSKTKQNTYSNILTSILSLIDELNQRDISILKRTVNQKLKTSR